ncbi:MAG: LemA family protein [Thauera sp.]|jgi:LemA protein|nr:LemA family protein [Thauera sp.]
MSISSSIFLGVLALALIYGVLVYNSLVNLRHAISKAWANIDVLLKQRHDELPKLVEVCRQYQQFEQTTLSRVTEARARVAAAREAHDVGALGAAESQLRLGLGQIFAVAEAYPELRANEHFKQLQTRISALEAGIADRRELYNDAVNLHNVRIEQFPDLIIARAFGYSEQSLLQFSSAEKADVDLRALFNG